MKIIKQNIINVERGIVAHGCNSQGVMGAGVAKAIRSKWPEAFQAYREACVAKNYSEELLGTCTIVRIMDYNNLYVANCITQHHYGFDGKVYANSKAIKQSMREVFEFANMTYLPLYTVKIGCGLGGLAWDKDVKPIFEELNIEYPFVNLFVCEL